ncbi:tetratricopeptide repeat protein [Elusimicrobiota bacterium]
MSDSPGRSRGTAIVWASIILIAMSTFVVYVNTLDNPFIFDDISKIVKNPDIKKLTNIKSRLIYPYSKPRQWYRNDPSRPLLYLTFTINYHLGKLNPINYRIFNILMHVANSILIFLFLKKIIFYEYSRKVLAFPLLVALFFSLHPINTEVVSYIFNRSAGMVMFFYITAIISFIRAVEGSRFFYVLAVFSFLLALASKQTAVTLPAGIMLVDYMFLSGMDVKRIFKRIRYHIPFWLILLVYFLFRYYYFGGLGEMETDAATTGWTGYNYSITQPYVILKYIRLLVFPFGFCFDHKIVPYSSILEPRILCSIILMVLIVSALFLNYLKKKDSESKIFLFSGLWFLLTLLPTSSFVPIIDGMAERRVYMPALGVYIIFTGFLFGLFKRNFVHELKFSSGRFLYLVFTVWMIFLGILTIHRNNMYHDRHRMWKDVIKKYPSNARAHNNMALFYFNDGMYEKALVEYDKAIKYTVRDTLKAVAHNNRGSIYKKIGEYDSALSEFKMALQYKQDFTNAFIQLGTIFFERQEHNKALQYLYCAQMMEPEDIVVNSYLGLIYHKLGNMESAKKYFKKIKSKAPEYVADMISQAQSPQ